jgi:hypothetical protein
MDISYQQQDSKFKLNQDCKEVGRRTAATSQEGIAVGWRPFFVRSQVDQSDLFVKPLTCLVSHGVTAVCYSFERYSS